MKSFIKFISESLLPGDTFGGKNKMGGKFVKASKHPKISRFHGLKPNITNPNKNTKIQITKNHKKIINKTDTSRIVTTFDNNGKVERKISSFPIKNQ